MVVKRGSNLEKSLEVLDYELDLIPDMKKVTSALPELCNNISEITVDDLKFFPALLKFIGSDDNNTIDGDSRYSRGFFRSATVNQCKQKLRNILKSPKDGGLPIDANTWNTYEKFSEAIKKKTDQYLAKAMTLLNNDFEFQTEAYEETVQRNDSGTSPEINKIKAQNNIDPRIALLLNGNPTKERMKPYYENLGKKEEIKDKKKVPVFYGQAWLNIQRACNLNKVGKLNVLGCGERFKDILDLPQVNIILIKFDILKIEKEIIVLQKKKDEIDTIHANVKDVPGIIDKLNNEKPANYEAEKAKLENLLQINIKRQKELIADSSIPSSDALFEQINNLKTELDELRSKETILLDNSNSSSSDPTIKVGSLLPSTTSAGGGRKSIKRRRPRHLFGRRITKQKRKSKSKSISKRKKKAIKSSRKKRFVF